MVDELKNNFTGWNRFFANNSGSYNPVESYDKLGFGSQFSANNLLKKKMYDNGNLTDYGFNTIKGINFDDQFINKITAGKDMANLDQGTKDAIAYYESLKNAENAKAMQDAMRKNSALEKTVMGSDPMHKEALDLYNNRQTLIANHAGDINGKALSNKEGFKDDAGNFVSNADITKANVWNTVKAHPWATAGTALNGGMYLSNLMDNGNFGGQLIGTAAGALIPAALGLEWNPMLATNVAMAAGNLGGFFDKAREKKQAEKARQQAMYGKR